LTIGAFAGLRRAEIERLDWSHIQLKRSQPIIEVEIEVSKTRARRPVLVQPNLVQWLKPYAKPNGPVVPLGLRSGQPSDKRLELLLKDARLKAQVTMPDNCLRHSFASYFVALCHDEAKCAEQMGSSIQMLRKHYRELADAADAATYFKISPNPDSPIRTFTLPVVLQVTHAPVGTEYSSSDIPELERYLNQFQTDAQSPGASQPRW
jgi:integrase